MRLSIPKLIASVLLGPVAAFFMLMFITSMIDYTLPFSFMWFLMSGLIYYALVNWKQPYTETDTKK